MNEFETRYYISAEYKAVNPCNEIFLSKMWTNLKDCILAYLSEPNLHPDDCCIVKLSIQSGERINIPLKEAIRKVKLEIL